MRVVSVFGFPLPFLLMGPAALFFLQYSVVPSRGQSHNTPPRDHTDPFDLDFTHQKAERLVARADTPRTGRFPLTFTPPQFNKGRKTAKKAVQKTKRVFTFKRDTEGRVVGPKKNTHRTSTLSQQQPPNGLQYPIDPGTIPFKGRRKTTEKKSGQRRAHHQ